MVDRPDPVCVPIEVELLPLHREPAGLARARRQKERAERRERREARESPTRAQRVLARLTSGRQR